jgi:hypothetical protein
MLKQDFVGLGAEVKGNLTECSFRGDSKSSSEKYNDSAKPVSSNLSIILRSNLYST